MAKNAISEKGSAIGRTKEPVLLITEALLKALKPGDEVVEGDPEVKRKGELHRFFGVRVTGTASHPVKTFIFRGRFPGSNNPTRRKIGSYPRMTLAEARKKAGEWRDWIEKGKDPAYEERGQREEEKAKRDAEDKAKENSFTAVAEKYIKRHVLKLRRADIVAREIRQELIARWGTRPVTTIVSADLRELVDEITDGVNRKRPAPVQAARVYSHAAALFNWAVGRDIIERSPCEKLKLSALTEKRKKRRRVLSADELRALWAASERLGYPFRDFVRTLALTGIRRREVAQARWSEINLDAGLWEIPADRMKMDEPFVVPLVPEVVELLKALPRFSQGDFVFSTTGGQKPISGFSKMKRRLDALVAEELGAELQPWCLHDIRRSFRTNLSALPITEEVRERLLAHAQDELSATYDRYSYLDEKRRALELWTARLLDMVRPEGVKDAEACAA